MKGHLPSGLPLLRCRSARAPRSRSRGIGWRMVFESRFHSGVFPFFSSGHTTVLTKEHFRLHPYWDTISASTMKRPDERFHRTIREKAL